MIAAAIVAAVVLLAAFNSMRGDIIPVRAARVVRGNIRSLISTNGKIEPIQHFEAHSPVAATIKRTLVKEGQQVKRGQLLMQLDDAEAQAAYDAAQDILNKSNIRAPFDGIVYAIPVQQGNYVSPGQLLLQEADLSKVRLRAFVDEPDVGRLTPGQKIEVKWDGLPGRIWQGSLTTVPSTIELFGTRNVGEITTELDNSDFKLLPNTNVRSEEHT